MVQVQKLFSAMTVCENVTLGGSMLPNHAEKEHRLAAVTESFRIVGERSKDFAGSLSGGQEKFVGFERAMMLDQAVTLVDGPSMRLEPKVRRLVFDTLSAKRNEGRTILADPSVGAIYMGTAGRPQFNAHVATATAVDQPGDPIGLPQEEG